MKTGSEKLALRGTDTVRELSVKLEDSLMASSLQYECVYHPFAFLERRADNMVIQKLPLYFQHGHAACKIGGQACQARG